MNALIVGRYQPFHLGHLAAVREALESCERLIIAIGSAQYSHTRENPFTAGERLEMIYSALRAEGLYDRTNIVPVIDVNRYAVWVSHVRSLVPPFQTIFTNNPLTQRLFSESGYEVRQTRIYNKEIYSGSFIREQMINGGDWKQSVHPNVSDIIGRFGGVDRVRELFYLSGQHK
jgi:nicotinamide-nucleotide adenylyltransferase